MVCSIIRTSVSQSILEYFKQYIKDRIDTFGIVIKTSSDAYLLSGLKGHIGLQDREEEGTKFLQDWVGGTLRTGTILMVRHFEFLTYSSSALWEHSVCFMSLFEHPSESFVTAARVRKVLVTIPKF